MTDKERIEAADARWRAAAHAMQTGVEFNTDKTNQTPKHLRVGVNVALTDLGSLARLLIARGVITEVEYCEALAAGMEEDAARHQAEVSDQMGGKVILA